MDKARDVRHRGTLAFAGEEAAFRNGYSLNSPDDPGREFVEGHLREPHVEEGRQRSRLASLLPTSRDATMTVRGEVLRLCDRLPGGTPHGGRNDFIGFDSAPASGAVTNERRALTRAHGTGSHRFSGTTW